MNDIVKKENQEIVPDQGTLIVNMIERVAMNPDDDVDKMERLLAMQEKVLAKQAETKFNQAMNSVQSEMGTIAADANNPLTRSKYATYAKLDKFLRPIYTNHGFSLSFDTGDAPENMVRVLAYVSHAGGHTRTYHADIDASGKGAKGSDVMTKTHATGSAMSFGMRYLLKLIFNVAVGEDDDDGNTAGMEMITEQQAADLQAKCEEVGADIPMFLKFLKLKSFSELPAKNFIAALSWLDAKAKQSAKRKK